VVVPGVVVPGAAVPGVPVAGAVPGVVPVPVPGAGAAPVPPVPGIVAAPVPVARVAGPTRGEVTPQTAWVRSVHVGSVKVGQVSRVNVAVRRASAVTPVARRVTARFSKSIAATPHGTAR
jgi:hypothetical protein